MRTRISLTTEDADAIMAACLAEAQRIGRNVGIAIVDDAGGLLLFRRMDGARAHVIDIAQRKARASATVGAPTSVIEAMTKGGPMQSPDMAVTAGGMPVVHDGQCAGAIGVSGAKADEDEAIARAGMGALKAPTLSS